MTLDALTLAASSHTLPDRFATVLGSQPAPRPTPGRTETVPATATATEPNAFAAFAEGLRRELAPVTLLETVLAERVVLASWRLRGISDFETGRLRAGQSAGPVGREALRAECSLETALSLFSAARRVNRPGWARPVETSEVAPAESESESDVYSNEWPTLPGHDDARGFPEADDSDRNADDESETETDDAPAPTRWQDRLVFDFDVSETSPVIKGTWVTVTEVVSRVVDGWSWSDVLRAHPELTEDDVRTCLAYAVAQDDDAAV